MINFTARFAQAAKGKLRHPIHEDVVVLVRTDPEPDDAFIFAQADGPVVQADVYGPDIAFGGKAERRVKRI